MSLFIKSNSIKIYNNGRSKSFPAIIIQYHVQLKNVTWINYISRQFKSCYRYHFHEVHISGSLSIFVHFLFNWDNRILFITLSWCSIICSADSAGSAGAFIMNIGLLMINIVKSMPFCELNLPSCSPFIWLHETMHVLWAFSIFN